MDKVSQGKNIGATGRLRLSGGAKPIFIKQLIWSNSMENMSTVTYGGSIKKYAQTKTICSGWSFLILIFHHSEKNKNFEGVFHQYFEEVCYSY
jgi:hypothetical protein